MTNYKETIAAFQAEAGLFNYSKIYGYDSDVNNFTNAGGAKYPLCIVSLPPSKTGLRSENDKFTVAVLVATLTGVDEVDNQQISEDLLRTFLNNILTNNKDFSIVNDSKDFNDAITVTRVDKVGTTKASGVIYSFDLLVYARCLN